MMLIIMLVWSVYYDESGDRQKPLSQSILKAKKKAKRAKYEAVRNKFGDAIWSNKQ